MIVAFGLTWAATACFGLVAPSLGRVAPARAAGQLLSLGGLLLAGLTTGTLLLVLAPCVGQQPEIADVGRWSDIVLARHDPIPLIVVIVAVALLVWLTSRLIHLLRGDGRRLLAAWRAADSVPGELLVLADDDSVAYALPGRLGRPGHIVVSRGLLRRLDADGRRALLAHERAHLRHRHDLLGIAAGLAAALNPLLWQLPHAVAAAAERQADGDAVAAVGDRRLVAAAIGVAVGVLPAPGLAASGADVVLRVEALLANGPRRPGRTVLGTAALCVCLLAACAATYWLTQDLDTVFDVAQAAWHR